jgi:Subtilase family
MILQGRCSRAAATSVVVAVVVVALASMPGLAVARESRAADGDLSPRLAELAKPTVRMAPPDKQAAILDVAPSGPGSLLRDSSRVLAEVRFDHGAAAGAIDLADSGARVVSVSPRYQTVTVSVSPGSLRALADVPRVDAVTESLAPILSGAEDWGPTPSAIRLCFGAATSEGDTQLNAMRARDAFSVDGSGVTVGILSDSFARDMTAATSAAIDVASGDLPGLDNPCGYNAPVDQGLDTYAGGDATDEGRAMAQIVHDLAPGARLAFATAFTGSAASFADNIRALSADGAQVIVDDVIYLDEPFFQEGPVGVAVSDVTDDGATYFSAAGNNNLSAGGRNIASWEAPSFRDSLSCPVALLAIQGFGAGHCMDFDPGVATDDTFGLTVSSGTTLTVDLQWAQPWFGVTSDIDAYLLNASGRLLAFDGGLSDNIGRSQKPYEGLSWDNDTGSAQQVQLVINRCSGTCNDRADSSSPRLKFALIQNGGGVISTEYTSSNSTDVFGPTIFGHNGSEDAMSVGAIRYSTTTAPETFSSRGPVTHYFGPVAGTTAAVALGSPNVLAKPDLVATDGGATTFFGSCSSDVWRFFGTSASAPHAAAVAALELQASPSLSPAGVKNAQTSTAARVGSFLPTAVGSGMLDAFATLGSIAVPGSGSQATQSTAPNCGQGLPQPDPDPVVPDTPAPITSSAPVSSPRDKIRPETLISQGPARVSFVQGQWMRVVFRFRSSEKGSNFLCKIDEGLYFQCHWRFVRWFGLGKHVLRVKARDAAGNVDRSPAVYRFRIEQAR